MEKGLKHHSLEAGTTYYPPEDSRAIGGYTINTEAQFPYAVHLLHVVNPIKILEGHLVKAAVVFQSDRQGEFISVTDTVTGQVFYVLKDSLQETFSTVPNTDSN